MAQIRETIEIFCRILKSNGMSKIKAETFRQAKFNGAEAVTPLWRLLFELLYYVEYGSVDEIAVKSCSELSTEELVIFVKHELQDRGFYSQDFASLPPDMSWGSRELLLAIGWLLCKEHVINRFMLNCTLPLVGDDTTDVHQISVEDRKSIAVPKNGLNAELDLTGRMHQILWLNNKMRLSLHILYSIQKEKDKLKQKIQEATHDISTSPQRNYLTMMEVYMLTHPEYLEKNLKLLERDNERLNDLLIWAHHEDIFWKWMESVLDAKMKQMNADACATSEDCTIQKLQIPAYNIERMHAAHLNLRESIIKYENIVDHLESMWQSKLKEVSDKELDNLLASIDLELSIQRANISLTNTADYLQKQSSTNHMAATSLISQKSLQLLQFQQQQTSASCCSTETWHDIQDDIASLHNTVEELQKEMQAKHCSFTDEMQQLSDHLEEVMYIPAMTMSV